eukprot:m.88257 g.88257  ORF g.88257 m.88257 type:complete len:405 (+) comp15174_c1_seq1:64-1278(+)
MASWGAVARLAPALRVAAAAANAARTGEFAAAASTTSQQRRWGSSGRSGLTSKMVADFRSDTVTQPTTDMRVKMGAAEVGDDVYGEDETVVALEKRAAAVLGKEAALFVASGTMANLIACGVHCGRGEELICGDRSHIYFWEAGGPSVLMGISMRTVRNKADGSMCLDELADAFRADDFHCANTKLVCLENTHNVCGGRLLDMDFARKACALAAKHGCATHLDGARLANAAVAQRTTMQALSQPFDTINLCLSKGLGAPIGSVLAGPGTFIEQAKRMRKLVGGGWRQAGVIAAAGLHALDNHVERMQEDHDHARMLASEVARLPYVQIDTASVETNIVNFNLTEAWGGNVRDLAALLQPHGVLLGSAQMETSREVRLVTHLNVSRAHVEYALEHLRAALSKPLR